MTTRDKIEVQQLKLTPHQMQAAMERACENVKTLAIWKDPKAPTRQTEDKK